jgi:hypothetical protein
VASNICNACPANSRRSHVCNETDHCHNTACLAGNLHFKWIACSNRDSAPQPPGPKWPSRLGRKQPYRASKKVWIFSAELVTKVDKYPVIAEPPAEVARIIDAIVAHPRYVLQEFCSSNESPRTCNVCSFRSIVFQIQESVKNPGEDLDCIDGAANLEGQRSAVCIAVVQFYSSLREVAVKSGCDSQILGLGVWSPDNDNSGRGLHTGTGTTANFLNSFKTTGIPEPVLDRIEISGSTRIQGPWLKAADGVIETIQVLETAEIDEDARTLNTKEAKLLVCKQMIEASCSMSDLRGKPCSALHNMAVICWSRLRLSVLSSKPE